MENKFETKYVTISREEYDWLIKLVGRVETLVEDIEAEKYLDLRDVARRLGPVLQKKLLIKDGEVERSGFTE